MRILQSLTYHERTILRLCFGLYDDGVIHTVEEAARYLPMTRARVRELKAAALAKLQHPAYRAGLQAFLAEPAG